MKQFQIYYDKGKFLALLQDEYCKRAGIIAGTSSAATDLCTRVVEWLWGRRRFNSLFIQGAPGTGKTTLVEALCSALKNLAEQGVAFNIQMRVKAMQLNNEERIQNGMLDLLSEAHGLLIDDLGSESPVVKIYGSEIHPMEQVIKRRSDDQLPTIVTTNLTLEKIAEQYKSERMADVLAQYDKMIINNSKSFRRL